MSQGQGGGRVYSVRNVDVDTREWTGRVNLGNTLGRNGQDTKVSHISPTLKLKVRQKATLSQYFHAGCLTFLRKSNFHLGQINKKRNSSCIFPLLACWSLLEATELAEVKMQSLGLA